MEKVGGGVGFEPPQWSSGRQRQRTAAREDPGRQRRVLSLAVWPRRRDAVNPGR